MANVNVKFNNKDILGGKGANLAQMASLGLPVPPGFTISTKVCEHFYNNKNKIPKKVLKYILQEIKIIEKIGLMNNFSYSFNLSLTMLIILLISYTSNILEKNLKKFSKSKVKIFQLMIII